MYISYNVPFNFILIHLAFNRRWSCVFYPGNLVLRFPVVTLSGNSRRQTVYTHRASVHQAAKLIATLLSNGSLPPSLWLTSHAGWLPRTGISSGTLCSVIEYGLPFFTNFSPWQNVAGFTNGWKSTPVQDDYDLFCLGVGHTMDLFSTFISVLCHSDWLIHGETCLRLDVFHPGRAWSSSPSCTWHSLLIAWP